MRIGIPNFTFPYIDLLILNFLSKNKLFFQILQCFLYIIKHNSQ